MIVTEIIEASGMKFVHNYSDEKYYIKKVGTDEIYAEAYDVFPTEFTYVETDKKQEEEPDDTI